MIEKNASISWKVKRTRYNKNRFTLTLGNTVAHSRRIYLINPRFQLRFSALVTMAVLISSLIYPFAIYDLMENFIAYVSSHSPEQVTQLTARRTDLIMTLILWQIGFSSMIFIVCVFFSHKIAGPVYKLMKFFSGARQGHLSDKLYFRKGDYFHELAADYNDTMDTILEKQRADFVYISEVAAYISNLALVVPEDKKIVLKEIGQKLNEIQGRFQ